MKKLLKHLEAHKSVIVDKWFDAALGVYHPETQRAFGTNKNKFSNPVGQTLKEGLERLLDALIQDASPETLGESITEVIRIRAVQDMKASEALAFVFDLKNVIRKELKADFKEPSLAKETDLLEQKIDAIGLCTFDIYAASRERVLEIRINDIKRNVASLLKRSSFFNSDDKTDVETQSNLNREPGEKADQDRKRGGGR